MVASRKAGLSVLGRIRVSLEAIARDADPKSVHFFRSSCRRLEAQAELTKGEAGRGLQKLARKLARARRLAGRVRDLDVQIALVRELEVEREREDKRRLLAGMEEDRARAARKLQKELDDEKVGALRERIAKASRRKGRQDAAALREHAWERAVENLASLPRDFARIDVKNLHELRLACKSIRYIAEQAFPRPEARQLAKTMKQTQDAIGLWHDWAVLRERAGELLAAESTLCNVLRSHERASRAAALRRAREVVRPRIQVEQPPALPASAKAPQAVRAAKPTIASAS